MNTALTITDFLAISPLLILLAGSLLLIILKCFSTPIANRWAIPTTLLTLFLALIAAAIAPISESPMLTHWLQFDSLSRFFNLLFLLVGIATTLLSGRFLTHFGFSPAEYLFLLLMALSGLLLIGSSGDFLTLFLGFETLSLALYVLCGYAKKWHFSAEAATKYFLLGALSAGFLVYGIALIYGAIGSTHFNHLHSSYQAITESSDVALFLGGASFITFALAFKATVVPAHGWAPDVYEGASTPVTAFMAVGTKIGAFAAFIRIFMEALPNFSVLWSQEIAFLAYLTLIFANIVALRQKQLRRFFAYSGIAHAGFLLIPVAVGGHEALSSLLFYLVVYAFATLCCFGVFSYLDKSEKGVYIHHLSGLYTTSPFLAIILTFCLLTLAGIPPTAGFLAKFYIFKVAFQAGYYGLIIVGLLTSILSAFYYLRIVAMMFSSEARKKPPLEESLSLLSVNAFSIIALLGLSLYPEPLLKLISIIDK